MLHHHEERAPLRRNITAERGRRRGALSLQRPAQPASPARCCTSTAGTTSWGCKGSVTDPLQADILRCCLLSLVVKLSDMYPVLFTSSASRSRPSGRRYSSASSPRCSWRAASCAGRGTTSGAAYDLILWAYVGGFIGARLFLIVTAWDQFQRDPFELLLSGSGWVWQGGLIGGAVAVIAQGARARLAARRRRRSRRARAWPSARRSAASAASSPATATTACPTDLPWGMSYPNGVVPTTERVHPTPIYESAALSARSSCALWRAARAPAPARQPVRTVSGLRPARCASRSSSCAAIRRSRSG